MDNPTDETSYNSFPSYLSHSTLPKNAPLPSEFITPLRRSHLALSTFKSTTHPLRTLVTFVGYNPTKSDDDATSLHSTIPIPIECGIYYYEVEVIDKGEEGFMSVGWMKEGNNLRRLVGWDKGSWGWHGDDGRSFEGQGSGEVFSETWTTADIVGCGIDFTTGRAFFTKNGKMLGHRFSNLSSGLHPAIGLRSVGESLAINFNGPFKFDIDSYVRSTKAGIWSDIRSTEVKEIPRLVDQVRVSQSVINSEAKSSNDKKPSKAALAQALQKELEEIEVEVEISVPETTEKETSISNQLELKDKISSAFVLDFLQHNGHSKAFSSLQNGMIKRGQLPSSDTVSATQGRDSYLFKEPTEIMLSDFQSKQEALIWLHRTISDSFENSLPSSLIEELSSNKLPISNQAQMKIYDILHLVYLSTLPKATDEALERVLEKGRLLRKEMKDWNSEEKLILEKAFGLLVEPEQLNMDVFWAEKRKEWADGLIKVLREINGLNQISNLEQALRQTHVVLNTLIKKNGKSGAAFVDLKQVFEK